VRAVTVPERTAEAVRDVIERWVGLLVDERFDEALALLATRPESPLETTWTPELLATVIRNYGFLDPHPSGATFRVTSIASANGEGPRFDATWYERPTRDDRWGSARYDLPLNGEWSDVTASFDILDGPFGPVLALDDVHVM
jgi:hypothetical protein